LEERGDVKPDYEKAFEYFYKAAKLKNPIGQSGLGYMYLHGLHVAQDYSEALNWFTLAAEQGWVEGHLYVGVIYYSKFITQCNHLKINEIFIELQRDWA